MSIDGSSMITLSNVVPSDDRQTTGRPAASLPTAATPSLSPPTSNGYTLSESGTSRSRSQVRPSSEWKKTGWGRSAAAPSVPTPRATKPSGPLVTSSISTASNVPVGPALDHADPSADDQMSPSRTSSVSR